MLQNDVTDKIIADLKRTGFPLEIEAASVMRELGWDISHQSFYRDSEKKGRSIDILATRLIMRKMARLERLTIRLVVECKKRTKNPWVFFVSGSPFKDDVLAGLQYIRKAVTSDLDTRDVSSILRHSHYFSSNVQFSVIAVEPFTGGRNETIHEAVTQVTMATDYLESQVQKLMDEPPLMFKLKSAMYVLYPTIIVEGIPMFELRIGRDGELSLAQTQHVIHLHHYGEKDFFIDIVSKDYLRNFVKSVNEEVNSLNKER